MPLKISSFAHNELSGGVESELCLLSSPGDIEDCHFRSSTKADARSNSPFHSSATVCVLISIAQMMQTGFELFPARRKCDDRTVNRQSDLTAMRVPRAIQIDFILFHILNEIRIVKQKDPVVFFPALQPSPLPPNSSFQPGAHRSRRHCLLRAPWTVYRQVPLHRCRQIGLNL